ncbi:hypothetical protein GO003_005875 [Methylicorpusculum oleiharenae]|uniref:hypothetical protein n=1 Tax=Methylicorpusculum oleiharenae TaxID=1338687 RepID=UPI00135A14BE|nr:hypothetical protein [Methylicorpusculum oleiharenae]MCD2449912.1 hypothetical protein [Methylicorpusculum oleiharenae]
MSEHIMLSYRRLFEVRVLHHYWLDQGATAFDLISVPRKKEQRLQDFDVRPLLEITPSPATRKLLKAYRAVFCKTALGFITAVPEQAVISGNTMFEFIVTVRDKAFCNYTALTLKPQRLIEMQAGDAQKVHRYKENVPVLSNLTGVSRGTGNNRVLFLSREIPAASANDSAEYLVLSGNTLKQLSGDKPGATAHTLTTQAKKNPVYVHQGDMPVLALPGDSGQTRRAVRLLDGIPDNVFALIQLHAQRPGDNPFSLTDNQGHAKAIPPVFEIRFKNRSTIRQYINKNSRSLEFEETDPLPLTFFGNSGSKRKPSETLVKPVVSNSKVIKLVSEIFV